METNDQTISGDRGVAAESTPHNGDGELLRLQQEAAEMRQIAEQRAQEIKKLNAQLEQLSSRQAELREMLLDAHDQLLRRDQELQISLSNGASSPLAPASKSLRQPRVTTAEYKSLIDRLRQKLDPLLPAGSSVLVVSKGDGELLKLGNRKCGHFPQNERGAYAGHHPADSDSAIAHLETLRGKGAQYLLFPSTCAWWLQHYAGFAAHLNARYVRAHEDEDCTLFDLSNRARAGAAPVSFVGRLLRRIGLSGGGA